MDLTDQPIDSSAHIPFDLKNGCKKAEVHELVRSLKVLGVIPLDHRIFELTYPVSVTEYLKHSVFHLPLLSVIRVGQDCVTRGYSQLRGKPLDGVDVYHALHVEKVDGDFNGVTLAYRVYWLDVRSINQLRNIQVVKFKWIFKLLKLLKLLLLVLMHPHYSRSAFRFYVHFIVGAVLGHTSSQDLIRLCASLLTVGSRVHVVRSFGKFVLETGHKTFV